MNKLKKVNKRTNKQISGGDLDFSSINNQNFNFDF